MINNPGNPSTDDYIRTEVPHWCQIEIWQAEDFYEAVPQMVDPVTGEPRDLDTFAALCFDLWIRSIAMAGGSSTIMRDGTHTRIWPATGRSR